MINLNKSINEYYDNSIFSLNKFMRNAKITSASSFNKKISKRKNNISMDIGIINAGGVIVKFRSIKFYRNQESTYYKSTVDIYSTEDFNTTVMLLKLSQ